MITRDIGICGDSVTGLVACDLVTDSRHCTAKLMTWNDGVRCLVLAAVNVKICATNPNGGNFYKHFLRTRSRFFHLDYLGFTGCYDL